MGTSLKKVAKKAKDYKYVLLVMRHAKTEPFGDGGDAGRELTDKGRKQAKASPKAWPRTRWCRRALRAPAPPGPGRPAIACLRCSATTRRSTIVRVCTKVGCSRYLTSLPRPRRSIASCWCSAMSHCVDRMPMAGELRIGCNAARHAESGMSPHRSPCSDQMSHSTNGSCTVANSSHC